MEKYARLRIDPLDYFYEEWQLIAQNNPSLEVVWDYDGFTVFAYLTKEQYEQQIRRPNSLWMAPNSSFTGWFDDGYFESKFQ